MVAELVSCWDHPLGEGGAGSPHANEGWDQLSTALVLQHMVHMTSCGNMGNWHQHGIWTMDPGVVISNISGLVVTTAPGGSSAGHSDLWALGQHDPQTATWPQVSAQPLWHLHTLWWQ